MSLVSSVWQHEADLVGRLERFCSHGTTAFSLPKVFFLLGNKGPAWRVPIAFMNEDPQSNARLFENLSDRGLSQV